MCHRNYLGDPRPEAFLRGRYGKGNRTKRGRFGFTVPELGIG